jgi:hypothetical protein
MGFLAQHWWRMQGAAGVAGEDDVVFVSRCLTATMAMK